jgi:pSer/pThr/pTyr-binding forkhead associated (FHA) protein
MLFELNECPGIVLRGSGGGGMMLPLVLGMSAALALAALVFALRSGASLGGLSKVVSRLTMPRGRPSPKGFTRDAAPASQFKHWGRTSALSLLSTGGGKSYSLGGGRALTVGRGSQCQITIDDDTVSSAHARLQLDSQGQRVAITDLNSSNGTFLNGKRMTSGHAQIGDVVRFGTAEFKLAPGGASGVVAPTPRSAPNRGWMLSGFDPSGRALQFELRPMVENGSAGEAATTWTFGRDKSRSQFVIDDGSVSGAHAEITYEPLQGLTLRDLGSTNGTRLDGEMLGKASVPLDETGQEITFGAAKLRLSRLV